MSLIERLISWCEINHIDIKQESDYVFNVPNHGKLLLIKSKGGNIINENLCFQLSEQDWDRISIHIPDYFMFEFGGRWYYCPLVDKDGEYEADFIDLKYIGDPTDSSEYKIEFVHLGVHTEYELLNGSGKAKDWCKKAKFLKQKSLGICDKNTLAGTLSFQIACVDAGIKPILGETISVVRKFDKHQQHQEVNEIRLFVMNKQGWQNLLRINNTLKLNHDNFIKEEDLFDYTEGLIVVFTRESYLYDCMNDKSEFLKELNKYKKAFSKNVYFQIDTTEFFEDKEDIKNLNNIDLYLSSYKNLIKGIIICDSYYIDQEMFMVKDYLNKINKKATKYNETQYYKTNSEIIQSFDGMFKSKEHWNELYSEFCKNTLEISLLCDFKIEIGKPRLPSYDFVPKDTDNESFFMDLIHEGLMTKIVERGIEDIDSYIERVKVECEVIIPALMVDYFLILWDIVNWSKKSGIMVGNGRGSVGGSLVAYLIDITDIDPIEHDLLFERFLNKTRVMPIDYVDVTLDGKTTTFKESEIDEEKQKFISMSDDMGANISYRKEMRADSLADIDLDFPSEYRNTVKNYIKKRFGVTHTCSVGTYTKLQLKSAIKDFCKVKGLDFNYTNFITKDIDNQINYTWKDLIKYGLYKKELYEFIQKYPDIVHMIKFILEQPRACSIHASAVLIVPNNLDGEEMEVYDWLPLNKIVNKEGTTIVSEWEGKYTDRAGFLKEDILGLTQLDKFMNMLKLIKKNTGTDVLLHEISLDDKKTYKLFSNGYNEDIFQFNGNGIKSLSKKVKPDNIEDLIAMNALYRPGPMESNAHNDYAEIKHGKKKSVIDRGMKSVTGKTHGLYVYQEQIMQAVVVAGGFTLVESDNFRSNMKKFQKEVMEQSKSKFISGALERDYDEYEANVIWNKLLAFGKYGFNRSHSAAYGIIAYWAQWFKANYPLEFWTTALQFASEDEIMYRISEMKALKQGIEILPPSVNVSTTEFQCSNGNIYWSLSKIKYVGEANVRHIIEERKNGEFRSYKDFITRIPKKNVNKKTLTCLILAGAFDEVEEIQNPVERMSLITKHCDINDDPIPEKFQSELIKKPYFWISEMKDLTGYGEVNYKELVSIDSHFKKIFVDYTNFIKAKDYKEVCVCGYIKFYKQRTTKHGANFCTIEFISNTDVINIMMWEETFLEYESELESMKGKVIAINGKAKFDDYRGCNSLFTFKETRIIYL